MRDGIKFAASLDDLCRAGIAWIELDEDRTVIRENEIQAEETPQRELSGNGFSAQSNLPIGFLIELEGAEVAAPGEARRPEPALPDQLLGGAQQQGARRIIFSGKGKTSTLS